MNTYKNKKLEVVESLFANGITIKRTKDKILIGRDTKMEIMNIFENKCHQDKKGSNYYVMKGRVILSRFWGHLLADRKASRKERGDVNDFVINLGLSC